MRYEWIEYFKAIDNSFQLYDAFLYNNRLYVYGRLKDKRRFNFVIKDYKPYFFVPRDNLNYYKPFLPLENTIKITCNDVKEFYQKRTQYKYTYEADIPFEYVFLSDINIFFNEAPNIVPRILYLDIEVYNNLEKIFPDPTIKEKYINLITLIDSYTENCLCIIVDPSNVGKYIEGNKMILRVKNEEQLLLLLIKFLHKIQPDILTGWNVIYFDINYIVKRIKKFYPHLLSKLSIFDIEPKETINETFGKEEYNIAGYTILDYQELYKKYSENERPEYNLDYISKIELGEQKVELDASYDEIYLKDKNKMIEYNIQDVELLIKLDKKLKFIYLVNELRALSGVKTASFNFQNTTRFGDNVIRKYIRTKFKKPLVMKSRHNVELRKYYGAIVFPPKIGLYDYVIDLDAKSMYPSAILSAKISPETFIGKIEEEPERILEIRKKVLNYHKEKKDDVFTFKTLMGEHKKVKVSQFANNIFKKINRISIPKNGSIFRNDIDGILPTIIQDLMDKREVNKNEMKKYGLLLAKIKEEKERKMK